MKYIDIHAHLNFPDFDEDREKVIERTIRNGMGVINIGTSLKTSHEVVKLTENEGFYACVGIHPTDGKYENIGAAIEELRVLASNPKVVGIGECGLDYFRIEHDVKGYKERQKDLFERQVVLAMEVGKPLMIHCRDAYFDVIDILERYKKRSETAGDVLYGKKLFGNIHFFAGNTDDIKKFLKLGFTISFTGVVTFAPQYRELIEAVPLDMMHAETDTPFVAPAPFRGKRNEPLYTLEVIKKIAEIKGEKIEKVSDQLMENAKRMFGVD